MPSTPSDQAVKPDYRHLLDRRMRAQAEAGRSPNRRIQLWGLVRRRTHRSESNGGFHVVRATFNAEG